MTRRDAMQRNATRRRRTRATSNSNSRESVNRARRTAYRILENGATINYLLSVLACPIVHPFLSFSLSHTPHAHILFTSRRGERYHRSGSDGKRARAREIPSTANSTVAARFNRLIEYRIFLRAYLLAVATGRRSRRRRDGLPS